MTIIAIAITLPLIVWWLLYLLGAHIALRDKLEKADAIVCLGGTRGNIIFLNEKIDTALRLFRDNWAPVIISQSMASAKVNENFKQIPYEKVQEFVTQGRITPDYADFVYNNFDLNLGANYIKEYAIKKGVPENKIITENASLHTKEHVDFILPILEQNHLHSIILITTPFHQKRSYETFRKHLPSSIKIINYAADSKSWNPWLWFLSSENRKLVISELKRILQYRKGIRAYIPRT